MNLERLFEEDKIKKVTEKKLDLSLTDRDLNSAKHSFESKDYDWALSIAYNSVLQAARALMFSLGYRPAGKNQHRTVFEFLSQTDIEESLIDYFDGIRKTRHIAVYDIAETVSEEMAKEAIKQAEIFVHKIRTDVHKIRTK
jgi:uncharacterized protein (UPF0332 family)